MCSLISFPHGCVRIATPISLLRLLKISPPKLKESHIFTTFLICPTDNRIFQQLLRQMFKTVLQLLISLFVTNPHHSTLTSRVNGKRLTGMLQNPPRTAPSIIGNDHHLIAVKAFLLGYGAHLLWMNPPLRLAQDTANDAATTRCTRSATSKGITTFSSLTFCSSSKNINGIGRTRNLLQRLQLFGFCPRLLEQFFTNRVPIVVRSLKVILDHVTDKIHGGIIKAPAMLNQHYRA